MRRITYLCVSGLYRGRRLLWLGFLCGCAALPILSLADSGTPDTRALLRAQADSAN